MYLEEAARNIIAFINKSTANISPKVSGEIETHVEKVMTDLRKDLKLAQPGNTTIGISFDENIALDYVPATEVVTPGYYRLKNGDLVVEVIRQDTSGIIRVEVMGYETITTPVRQRFDYFSTSMFTHLFLRMNPAEEMKWSNNGV